MFLLKVLLIYFRSVQSTCIFKNKEIPQFSPRGIQKKIGSEIFYTQIQGKTLRKARLEIKTLVNFPFGNDKD